MAVLTRLWQWVRSPSIAVHPLYVALLREQFVIRCWLCHRVLWNDGMVGDRSRVLAVGDLTDALNRHAETCRGWR